ncbi:unnamed protein product [Linum tenue]|uniref:Uncharacterized protein n=1 Tax=Linum tenue TaxID=586396 RepID=A0AAV0KM06_9ROSI|nr:unnamed protein product [Linum tenue]
MRWAHVASSSTLLEVPLLTSLSLSLLWWKAGLVAPGWMCLRMSRMCRSS